MNTPKDAVPAPVAATGKGKGKDKPPKEEPDHEFEGLMSEIEGDLRADEFKKIWNRYGNVIMVFVMVLLGGVTAAQLYRQHSVRENDAAWRRYELAVKAKEEGRSDEALKEFGGLIADGGKGYGALSRLSQAAIQVEKKDIAGAVANYKALAADRTADPILRDTATVLYVLHSLDREDPKALEAALTPVANPNNAFNLSALELQALLAAKQGDMARAVKTLAQISADPSAPPSMRERVDDLTAYYQAGIIPPAPTAPITTPPAAPTATPAPAAPAAAAPPAAAPASAKPPASKP